MLVELLAAARIALCVQAARPVDAVVLVDPVFVGVVAVVVVVVGATVDVVVEPADWLLGLLSSPPARQPQSGLRRSHHLRWLW